MNVNDLRKALLFNVGELWAVSSASMIRSIGMGMSWPFLAIFLHNEEHIPIYYVGLLFTLSTVVSITFSMVGGGLSDRFGRKGMLLTGSILGAGLYMVLASLVFQGSPVFYIELLFVLSNISGAFVFPAASALVSDVTSESQRTMAYSLYRIMSNVGWAVGPLVGGFIYDSGMYYIFALLSLTSIAQFSIVLLYVKKREGTSRNLGRLDSFLVVDKYLIAFASGTFFVTLIASQFSVTLPIFATNVVSIPTNQIGYIYAVNGFIVVAGQYPMSWLLRHMNDINVMVLGSAFYALGYFLIGFSHDLLGIMLDMVIITVGENLTSPGMNSVVSKIAPKDKVGRYMGFLSMMNSSGRAIGPSIGTVLMFIFAYQGFEVWTSLSMLGVTAVFILLAVKTPVTRRADELRNPETAVSQ